MKYLTKENILLVLVSFLVLAHVTEGRKSPGRSEKSHSAIQRGMRGMDRTEWGARMERWKKAREGKAKVVVSSDQSCCDKTN